MSDLPTLTAQQSAEKIKKAIDIKKKPMGNGLYLS